MPALSPPEVRIAIFMVFLADRNDNGSFYSLILRATSKWQSEMLEVLSSLTYVKCT